MDHSVKHEVLSTAVQSIPAVTLVGVHIAGLTLPEWAAVGGMAFILFQAAHLFWVWRQEIKGRR